MTGRELIEALAGIGVSVVRVTDESLALRGNTLSMPAELVAEVKKMKAELLLITEPPATQCWRCKAWVNRPKEVQDICEHLWGCALRVKEETEAKI